MTNFDYKLSKAKELIKRKLRENKKVMSEIKIQELALKIATENDLELSLKTEGTLIDANEQGI